MSTTPHGRLDVELHQIDEGRAAGDEPDVRSLLRRLRLGAGGDRRRRVRGTRVLEAVHERRTCWIAATMFG